MSGTPIPFHTNRIANMTQINRSNSMKVINAIVIRSHHVVLGVATELAGNFFEKTFESRSQNVTYIREAALTLGGSWTQIFRSNGAALEEAVMTTKRSLESLKA